MAGARERFGNGLSVRGKGKEMLRRLNNLQGDKRKRKQLLETTIGLNNQSVYASKLGNTTGLATELISPLQQVGRTSCFSKVVLMIL